MHANRFEREVQGKLDGMQLQPTPPVWAAVEARIRRERRKRRMLLFWFLPLLLLGGFALYQLGSAHGTATHPATADAKPGHRSSTGAANNTPGSSQPTVGVPSLESEVASDPKNTGTLQVPPITTATEPGSPGRAQTTAPTAATQRAASNETRTTTVAGAGARIATKTMNAQPARTKRVPAPQSQAPVVAASPLQQDGSTAAIVAEDGKPTDTAQAKTVAQVKLPDTILQATPPTPMAPKPRRQPFQWTFEAGGGIAAPVGAASKTRADAYAMISSSSSGQSTQSWASGPALHASALINLPLKGRLRLQTGLGLEWMQLRLETNTTYNFNSGSTGTPFTGTAGTGATKTVETQRLTYLQLPLALEWRPSARSSFLVNAGLRVDQLLNKTVVQGLEPTTLNLQLGARFRLMKLGRHSLEAGPQLSGGLTRFDARQRLFHASAVVRFSF